MSMQIKEKSKKLKELLSQKGYAVKHTHILQILSQLERNQSYESLIGQKKLSQKGQLQIDKANKVLSLLQKSYPSAKISGGAPRDWYLGDEARDIDVCIPVKAINELYKDSEKLLTSLLKILKPLNAKKENFTTLIEAYGDIVGFAHGVIFEHDGLSYDFIFTTKENMPQLFDVSLSNITFDGKQFNPSTNFLNSLVQQEIKVPFNRLNEEKVRNYVTKLKEKFPTFNIVVD